MSKPCENKQFYCDGEVGDNSEHSLCHNCRAHKKRWKERSPKDLRAWHHRLQLWDHRLQLHPKFSDDERRSTRVVVPLHDNTTIRKRA